MAATIPMTIRVPEELHRRISVEATRQGVTLNDVVRRALEASTPDLEASGPDGPGFCILRGAGLVWIGHVPNVKAWHHFNLRQLDGDAVLDVSLTGENVEGFAVAVRKKVAEAHIEGGWHMPSEAVEALVDRCRLRASKDGPP